MKKSEVFDILWHLWNNVDQADCDYGLMQLMNASPIEAQKKFIESLVVNNTWEYLPDEDILIKAKKLCGVSD